MESTAGEHGGEHQRCTEGGKGKGTLLGVKAVRRRLTHPGRARLRPARRRCGEHGAGELGGSGRPGASTPCPRRAGPVSWLGGRAGPGLCWGRYCRRLGGGCPAPCWRRGPGPGLGSSSGAGGRPPPRVPLGAAPRAGARGAAAMAGLPARLRPPGRRNLPPPSRAAPPAPAPAEPFPAPAEPGRAAGLPRRETRA